MLTLYYFPHACSMASHVALEEAGAAFELKKVNILTGEQFKPEYREINPRAKVPALRFDDGQVLLESTAILGWIGNAFPDQALLGSDPFERAQTIATCAWLSGTVHPTFTKFYHPEQVVSAPEPVCSCKGEKQRELLGPPPGNGAHHGRSYMDDG